jgi:hypothetical protein
MVSVWLGKEPDDHRGTQSLLAHDTLCRVTAYLAIAP